ncbi:hypothetical protein Tsubulata_027383, partial [Turnera subulata]
MGRILFFLIQKRFLKTLTPPPALLSPASPVLTTADSSPATSSSIVEYLTSSCGLSSKSALSVSQKLKFRESNLRNPQLVLHFLKAHNFSDTHIAKIIQKAPRVLLSSVEDTLRPKFDFLIGIGFAGRLLPDLIASDPFVLCRSLDSHLKACFQLLRPFLESNNKFGLSIRRCSWLLSGGFRGTVQANLEFLTKQGVPANCIGKLLLSHPRTISQKHERVVYTLQAVKGLGYDPESPMFVHAFGVMMRMRESTWKKKIELLKSFGWSEEEILTAFRRYPFFMECSEEKLNANARGDRKVVLCRLEPKEIRDIVIADISWCVYPSLILECFFLRTFSSTLSPPPTTTLRGASGTSFILQFLINSCGLSPKSALSASGKLQLHQKNLPRAQAQAVLECLEAHNFGDTHIAKSLIQKRPRVLHCNVETNMKPKFSFFIDNGCVAQLLPELFLSNPKITHSSLDSRIKSLFLFPEEVILAAIRRFPFMLSFGYIDNVPANVDFLVKEGVAANRVGKLLQLRPRILSNSHVKVVCAVNAIRKIGLQPKAPMFIHAFVIEVMKSLGWSEEETMSAFKQCPCIMAASEEKIRSATDLYLNAMKFGRKDILRFPVLLKYSLVRGFVRGGILWRC